MRPMRFQSWLKALLSTADSVAGVRLTEDDPSLDNAVEVTLGSGARILLTTIGSAAPGANDYSVPEEIVEGEVLAPVPPVQLDTSGSVRVADFVAFLTAALINAGSPEIATIEVMPPSPSHQHTIELRFHSGAKVWIYFRHALRAGEQPSAQQAYKVREMI